ncbi:MAG: 4'-phosphopantetheinyl transferase [Rhodothermaceae bacterium]|nr:4'-phosphopantetheinyl transferase [Rhodothermaceae bacterium]
MTALDLAWRPGANVAASLLRAPEADPALLSHTERERMATFGHPDRQRQFLLGRTAARSLVGATLATRPEAVVLRVGADGAPVVDGVRLSIAHTGHAESVAAAAAVAAGPVGVDLERVARRRPDLWRRILRPDEYGVLEALGGPTDDAQTLLWTLKEAVLKGQRTGFRAGGRSVCLALDADGRPADHGRATAEADGSGAWTVAFRRDGDLWLAVAWQAPEGQEKQTR